MVNIISIFLGSVNNNITIFKGLIVGAIIRYTGSPNERTHITVDPQENTVFNASLPPDALWLQVCLLYCRKTLSLNVYIVSRKTT